MKSEAIRTIEHLKEEFRISVMEADIDLDVDAQTISALSVKTVYFIRVFRDEVRE